MALGIGIGYPLGVDPQISSVPTHSSTHKSVTGAFLVNGRLSCHDDMDDMEISGWIH